MTNASSSLSSVGSDISKRHSLLPTFSRNTDTIVSLTLLMTNVPEGELTTEQLENRYRYAFHERSATKATTDHQRRIAFLSRLWNVNHVILENNFAHLMKIIHLLGANRIHRFSVSSNEAYLHEDEYSIALEFFLQIDRQLFYMKTCSYRGSVPVPNETSLLCKYKPQIRYGMTRCNRVNCYLCYPPYKLTYRHHQPAIDFESQTQHQFVNQYRSILNCPATCQTRNIIYVLTCPCHRVDYIGETSLSLASRLCYHRKHGNRIIQEFLFGPKILSRIQQEIKSNEVLTKDAMTLYQHSTTCSYAMQWFLDENPDYWPFVPIEHDDTKNNTSTMDSIAFDYANDIPLPSNHYQFTYEQKVQIERFFHEKKYLTSPPNFNLDLYHASIVAMLPINGSNAIRRLIEALFITHTQAQLNSDGHLDTFLFPDTTFDHHDSSQQHEPWFKHLVRHPFHP